MKPCQIDQSKLDTKAGTHVMMSAEKKKERTKERKNAYIVQERGEKT
jgi:hypothetical protein